MTGRCCRTYNARWPIEMPAFSSQHANQGMTCSLHSKILSSVTVPWCGISSLSKTYSTYTQQRDIWREGVGYALCALRGKEKKGQAGVARSYSFLRAAIWGLDLNGVKEAAQSGLIVWLIGHTTKRISESCACRSMSQWAPSETYQLTSGRIQLKSGSPVPDWESITQP